MDSSPQDCNQQGITEWIVKLEKHVNELKIEINKELRVLALQIAENTKALQEMQNDMASTIAVEVCRLMNLHKTSESSFQHNTPHGKGMRYPSAEITSELEKQVPGSAEVPIVVPDSNSPFQLASTSKDPSACTRKKLVLDNFKDILHIPFDTVTVDGFELLQISVVSYTFSNKPPAEVLVDFPTFDHICSRQSLQSLAPSRYVVADVINAWVCYLIERENEMKLMNWFLPTTFAERVKKGNFTVEDGIRRYRTTVPFIKKNLKDCEKLFIPMVRKMTKKRIDQWFLMIVDLEKKEVLYVDSATDSQRTKTRNEIEKMLKYLEDMLAHPSFHEMDDYIPPQITTFKFGSPECLAQQIEHCDSAVWVMWWMDHIRYSEKFNVGPLTDYHRMSILVDLLTSPQNEMKIFVESYATKAFGEDA